MVAGGMIAAARAPGPIPLEMATHAAHPAGHPSAGRSDPTDGAPAPDQGFGSVPGGHVLVGLDRPDDVLGALGGAEGDGYMAPVHILEPDSGIADGPVARSIAAHPRVRLHAGDGCDGAFLDWCRERIECALPARFHVSGPRVAPMAQSVAGGLRGLIGEQERVTRETRKRLEATAQGRGIAYWADRYAEIDAGSAPRVLVVTSRFSTYLKYSGEDLAGSLRAHGTDARVLMQRDRCATLVPLSILSEIERFDPDLIVVINYTRSQRSEMFPAGWPCVCWVQDAMNHMFQKSTGSVTPLDFLAGHVYAGSGLVEGYDEASIFEFPVPVSSRKFHDAPITEGERARFACDVAYVSHQSETARGFHDRLIAQFDPPQRGAFERCFTRLRGVVDGWADGPQEKLITESLEELMVGLGRRGDAAALGVMRTQYVYPIIERLLRHQSLDWAGRIAGEHGLEFRIFGSGWEKHPTLHPFAQGPIEHGGALRACYQAAGVHLHVSALGCGHQRVVECAFSGGLPISRRSWDEQYRHDWARMTGFMRAGHEPDATLVEWRWPAYAVANHPELAAIIGDRARMPRPEAGWDHEHFDAVYARVGNDPYFKYWDGPVPPERMRPLSMMGDPLELTFSTAQDLEALIVRAAADPWWRQKRSEGVAQRASAHVSMDRFAEGLLGRVGERLRSLAPAAVGRGAKARA